MKEKVFLEFGKDGLIILRKKVDISPLLSLNQREKKIIGKGFSKKKTWRKIGSIPIDVFFAIPDEQKIELLKDGKAIKKFLKENPQYRVSEGEI